MDGLLQMAAKMKVEKSEKVRGKTAAMRHARATFSSISVKRQAGISGEAAHGAGPAGPLYRRAA